MRSDGQRFESASDVLMSSLQDNAARKYHSRHLQAERETFYVFLV